MGELHRHWDSNHSHLAMSLTPPPPPIKFVLSLCSPPNPSNHHNALSIQDGSWQEAQHSSGNFAQETGLSSTGVRFKTEFNLLRFTKCRSWMAQPPLV